MIGGDNEIFDIYFDAAKVTKKGIIETSLIILLLSILKELHIRDRKILNCETSNLPPPTNFNGL